MTPEERARDLVQAYFRPRYKAGDDNYALLEEMVTQSLHQARAEAFREAAGHLETQAGRYAIMRQSDKADLLRNVTGWLRESADEAQKGGA